MFDPQPGEVIDGFELLRCVGRGGFGVVFQAFSPDHERTVALKILRPPSGRKATAAGRFLREVDIVRRLDHPRIIKVYDAGEIEESLYYTMEFLQGHDLETQLIRSGALPIGVALEIAMQTLEGLAAAHARGVIHRDIKPANIFLQEGSISDPDVKVLDFGIATMPEDPDQDTLTGTGMIVGTPRYMAPETIFEGNYAPASDVYAIALVLLEMLNGEAAFVGAVDQVLLAQAVVTPDVPEPLQATPLEWWFEKTLSKDPGFRPANAEEALEGLRRAAEALAERADERVSDRTSQADVSVQVVLSAADRAALSRARAGSEPEPGDEQTINTIITVAEVFAEAPTPPVEDERPSLAIGPRDDDVAETGPMPGWMEHAVFEPAETEEEAGESATIEPAVLELAETSDEPLPTASNVGRLWGVLLAGALAAVAFLVVPRPDLDPPDDDSSVRFRVESKPPAAFFTIDGTVTGRTPQVIEWANDDFPIVVEFRHPNGGTATEHVAEPPSVVSVVLTPPRTRPDTPPSEHEETSDDVLDVELVEEVRASVKTQEDFDVTDLLSTDRDINKEFVLTATQLIPSTEPRRSTGTWWADTQARLTELAMPCVPPDIPTQSDEREKAPPREPFVVNMVVRINPYGRVETASAEAFDDAQTFSEDVHDCMEGRIREQFVPAPPEKKRRREQIPLLF